MKVPSSSRSRSGLAWASCSSSRRAGSILGVTVIVVSFFELVLADHSKDHAVAVAYAGDTLTGSRTPPNRTSLFMWLADRGLSSCRVCSGRLGAGGRVGFPALGPPVLRGVLVVGLWWVGQVACRVAQPVSMRWFQGQPRGRRRRR